MAITETIFNAKNYLTLRKSISTDKISDKQMYDDAGKKLGRYMKENGITPSGPWSVLYFTWDEENKKTDIGIAFPVEEDVISQDSELTIVTIPESKASLSTLVGSYDGLAKIHKELMQYVKEKDLEGMDLPVLAVEEYMVDPGEDPNPENWMTNVYYLHN